VWRSLLAGARADRRVYRPPKYDCWRTRRRTRNTEKSSPARTPLSTVLSSSPATIKEAVDCPHEPVVGAERLVPLHLISQDPLGRTVVEHHSQNQTVVVVHEPHFCGFGRRRAIVRLALKKTGGDSRAFPHGFVGHAVQPDHVARSEPKRGHDTVWGADGILGPADERTQEEKPRNAGQNQSAGEGHLTRWQW